MSKFDLLPPATPAALLVFILSLDPPPVVHVSNECDLHRRQLEMGRKFVGEHRRDVLQMDLKKRAFLFYDVGETPRMLLPTHLFRMMLIVDRRCSDRLSSLHAIGGIKLLVFLEF